MNKEKYCFLLLPYIFFLWMTISFLLFITITFFLNLFISFSKKTPIMSLFIPSTATFNMNKSTYSSKRVTVMQVCRCGLFLGRVAPFDWWFCLCIHSREPASPKPATLIILWFIILEFWLQKQSDSPGWDRLKTSQMLSESHADSVPVTFV